jgi:hypothetical protein
MKGTGIEWATSSEQVENPLYVMENPGEFWVGRVVIGKHWDDKEIGHITGFSRNSVNEVLVKVAWSDGRESSVHPANIELQ